MNMLGKRPQVVDPRTFQLSRYLPVPAPPAEVSWVVNASTVQPWEMYLNDRIGDCVFAAAGHMIRQWNYYAGRTVVPTDDDILKAYEVVGGYQPGNPNTDNGANMLSALKYWRKVGIGGHQILAFVELDPRNAEQVRSAVQLFGNVFLGVQLPIAVQDRESWTVAEGGIYTVDGEPGSWGGHCLPIMASSPLTHTVVTWGSVLKMSHNFLTDYADEAYAVLTKEWMDSAGMAPSGFDIDQLWSDLNSL